MARTHTARQFGGGGKFFAPPAFIDGVNTSDYYYEVYAGDSQTGFSGTYYTVHKQAYYETMVNRLYRFHGSAREPQPFVTEVGPELTLETRSGREFTRNIVPQAENSTAVRFFSPMEGGLEAAKEYANESEARQVGGLGPYPSKRVPALEHYRLVKVSDVSGGPWNAMQPGLASILNSGTQISGITSQRQLRLFQEQNPQWTKVFERVPGGTIEGQGPANKQVHAAVEMKMPTSNQTFLYRQQVTTDDEGHFSMTVPYSSTGAENWGPEHGYTNTSVRAASQYEVFTDRERETVDGTRITTVWNDTVDVTEGQVIGENDSVSTVELTETVLSEQDLNDSEDDTTGNETDDTTPGNETDDSTAGNETEDTTSNNETNSTELIADPVSPEFEPAALGAPIAR